MIRKGDPWEKLFSKKKETELAALSRRGTCEIIRKDTVADDANIFGGRFVLAIKDEGTKKEVGKARFVVQGYRD